MKHGAEEFVELCPDIPYEEALAEMISTDVLLLMPASNCNGQIPAKLHEYSRAGKPTFGLTNPDGDTAQALRITGCSDVLRLDSTEQIAQGLPRQVRGWQQGNADLPRRLAVQQASRRSRTHALADLLDLAVLQQ